MVVIETENGRFEADTIRDAQKLERKAARVAAKRQAAIGKLQTTARLHAAAAGFSILSRIAEGRAFPAGWSFRPAGTNGTSARQLAGEFGKSCNLEIETEQGKAVCDFYGLRFLGSVENGAGWTIAIALRDDRSADVDLYSVGACDGEIGTQKLWNVRPEDFRQRGEKTEDFRARIGRPD